MAKVRITDTITTHNVSFRVPTQIEMHMNADELRQLILGTKLVNKQTSDYREVQDKLLDAHFFISSYKEYKDPVVFTRHDLFVVREVLEARMEHCKLQREEDAREDSESNNFIIETFVLQQSLLLDIREALLGDIVEE